MTFGARMLKTGIAVTLALYISMWLHLTSPVISAVAAIFAMQPSIYRSWRYFLDQLQTNTLGAVLALIAGLVFSNEPIAVGLVCIIVIMICLKLKMGDTIGLTLVTVIVVMEASGQWQFALTRFSLSLIGIVSAFLINVLLFPPKPKMQFTSQIQSTFNQMSLLMRTAISDEIKENIFRDKKRELEDSIKSLSDKYKLLEEEQKKLKRAKFSQTRHLVVYKQMLNTLRKGREVLDAVEEHYFQSERSAELDQFFDQQLEKLIKLHEYVLLKFDDNLKPGSVESSLLLEESDAFIQHVLEYAAGQPEYRLRLTIVASTMYDYGYQLERLNRLVEHYHKSDDEALWLSWLKR
ncbi:aromatic acid exporter family protein [Paenibacillus chibensis]|uniref:Aromatic acid exporter family protein n=1 Tax=Paenibacillus chibensis TaxID=59846 RepID=A0ABU6PLI4_9BACL|nr:aromatic acid exporter family protein [Paenibacillus chibensis]